jgi:hypothetical protein
MNIEKKKLYIYEKIENKEIDHGYIKPYIISNNIAFSENKNGIFINISLLSDEIIDDLYIILYNYINNKVDYDREKKIKEIQKNINNKEILTKENIKAHKPKYNSLKNLNKIQEFILNNSKKI